LPRGVLWHNLLFPVHAHIYLLTIYALWDELFKKVYFRHRSPPIHILVRASKALRRSSYFSDQRCNTSHRIWVGVIKGIINFCKLQNCCLIFIFNINYFVCTIICSFLIKYKLKTFFFVNHLWNKHSVIHLRFFLAYANWF
jgi:hypothetical protein